MNTFLAKTVADTKAKIFAIQEDVHRSRGENVSEKSTKS